MDRAGLNLVRIHFILVFFVSVVDVLLKFLHFQSAEDISGVPLCVRMEIFRDNAIVVIRTDYAMICT